MLSTSFEHVTGDDTVFGNLNLVTILLENFDSQFLVDEVILGEENVEGLILLDRYVRCSARLEGRYKC